MDYIKSKISEIKNLKDDDIINKMRSSKASYAGFLEDIITKNSKSKPSQSLIPIAVINAFEKLKKWGHLC